MKKILFLFLAIMLVGILSARPAANRPTLEQVNENREFEWEEQNSNFPNPSTGINSMHAVDENIVWAAGYDGSGGGAAYQVFTRTTDGGANWSADQIDTAPAAGDVAMIFALDENKAWVPIHTGVPQGIYYTEDGGVTWERQETADYNLNGSFPNVVHFWDENDGFAQGDPVDGYYELYTTTDGGENWIRVPEEDIPAPITGEFGVVGYYDVVNDKIWWGTNKGRVYYSEDRGYTWEVAQTTLGNATYVDVRFKDEMNGIAQDKNAASTGALSETSDGGVTWEEVTHSGTAYTNDFEYIPGTPNTYVSTGAATGLSGASYSHDGGHNWTVFDQTTGVQFLATTWINSTTGWAGCFNDISNPALSGVYKYTGDLTPQPMGILAGVVADLDSGTPIANVELTVGDITITTNDMGEFSMQLDVGTYDISLDVSGFEPYTMEDVAIIEDQTTEVDIDLQNLYLPATDLDYSIAGSNVVLEWNHPQTMASITNYEIYRDDELLSTISGGNDFYIDQNVPGGTHIYYVVAIYYDDYPADPSNEITVEIISAQNDMPIYQTALIQNTPNPFNPTTTIFFNVTKSSAPTNINIYNLKGQLVRSIAADNLSSGRNSVVWNGTDNDGKQVTSGVYFYHLNIDGRSVDSKRMLLLK